MRHLETTLYCLLLYCWYESICFVSIVQSTLCCNLVAELNTKNVYVKRHAYCFSNRLFFLGTFENLSSLVTLISLEPLNGILLNLILESFIKLCLRVPVPVKVRWKQRTFLHEDPRLSLECNSLMLLARKKIFQMKFLEENETRVSGPPHFPPRFAVLRDVTFKTVLRVSEHNSFCGCGLQLLQNFCYVSQLGMG
jgi:hypothetical protein